jgi:transcriptional regulator with XRE-family HTH domain
MFSQRIKALRLNKKMTQQDIALLLGITRQAYAKYENDQSEPDNHTLKTLADYYHVSIDYLLGRTDDSEENPKGEMYFFDKDKWTPEEIEEARAFIEARRQMKKNKK